MPIHSVTRSLIGLMLVCVATGTSWAAEAIPLPSLGATVQPITGWTSTSEAALTSFSTMVTRGVAAHAKAKNITLQPGEAEARLLAMWSTRHPNGDNPNVILQTERIWGPAAGKTGKDFIELMTERCSLFAKHNQRQGMITEWKTGTITFHCADFENRQNPQFITRQEYIATVTGRYYVVFVLSYNDKTDADYKAMRAFAGSFALTEPVIKP